MAMKKGKKAGDSPTLSGLQHTAAVMSRLPKQEMMEGALMFYAASAYQKLSALTWDEVKEVGRASSDIAVENPLHMICGDQFVLPHIGGGLSGLQIMAYLAVSVDVLSNYQLTDNAMTSFQTWMLPARELAGCGAEKEAV